MRVREFLCVTFVIPKESNIYNSYVIIPLCDPEGVVFILITACYIYMNPSGSYFTSYVTQSIQINIHPSILLYFCLKIQRIHLESLSFYDAPIDSQYN